MPSTLLCILHRLHCRGRLQSCANALGDVNSLVPPAVQLSHLDCLVLSAPQLVSLPFFSRRHIMPIDRKFPMPACPYHPRERRARGNLFDPRKFASGNVLKPPRCGSAAETWLTEVFDSPEPSSPLNRPLSDPFASLFDTSSTWSWQLSRRLSLTPVRHVLYNSLIL